MARYTVTEQHKYPDPESARFGGQYGAAPNARSCCFYSIVFICVFTAVEKAVRGHIDHTHNVGTISQNMVFICVFNHGRILS